MVWLRVSWLKKSKDSSSETDRAVEVRNLDIPEIDVSSQMPLQSQDFQKDIFVIPDGVLGGNGHSSEVKDGKVEGDGKGKGVEEDVFGGMGNEETGVTVAKGLMTPDLDDEALAMKSELKNPHGFATVQLNADFSESIGLVKRAKFRRAFCRKHYVNDVAHKGKRAVLVAESIRVEVNKEFEIAKKGSADKLLGS